MSFQEGTVTVLSVKLTQSPPSASGENKKETKRKWISSRNDSNHRGIRVNFTNKNRLRALLEKFLSCVLLNKSAIKKIALLIILY